MNRRFIPSLESLEGRQLLATVAAAFTDHSHDIPAETAPPAAALPTVSIQIEQQPTCDVVICTISGGTPHRVELLGGEGEWTDLSGTVRLTVPSDTRTIVLQATTAEGEALPLLLVEFDPSGRVVSQSWSTSSAATPSLGLMPDMGGLHAMDEGGMVMGSGAASDAAMTHGSARIVDAALADHGDAHGALAQANVVAAHAESHLPSLRIGRHMPREIFSRDWEAAHGDEAGMSTSHRGPDVGAMPRSESAPAEESTDDYDAVLGEWGAHLPTLPASELPLASLQPLVPIWPAAQSASTESDNTAPRATEHASDDEIADMDEPGWLTYAGAFAISIGCLGGVIYVERRRELNARRAEKDNDAIG